MSLTQCIVLGVALYFDCEPLRVRVGLERSVLVGVVVSSRKTLDKSGNRVQVSPVSALPFFSNKGFQFSPDKMSQVISMAEDSVTELCNL